MARGGARPGAGRKKGAVNKVTAEARAAALASGVSPLHYMLSIMRDESVDVRRRDAMAMAAAPYLHPKLSAVAYSEPQDDVATDEYGIDKTFRIEFVQPQHRPDD